MGIGDKEKCRLGNLGAISNKHVGSKRKKSELIGAVTLRDRWIDGFMD